MKSFSHEFRLTATFEELEGGTGTKLTFRQTFGKAEEFEQVKGYCVEGNKQNIDRLQQLLARLGGE